jgi:predicted DNA-binding protein (MmcQ/YjbR family)
MDANEILDYCLAKKGVTESFPFDNETLVLKVGTKMFLLMALEKQPLSINVKTDPE